MNDDSAQYKSIWAKNKRKIKNSSLDEREQRLLDQFDDDLSTSITSTSATGAAHVMDDLFDMFEDSAVSNQQPFGTLPIHRPPAQQQTNMHDSNGTIATRRLYDGSGGFDTVNNDGDLTMWEESREFAVHPSPTFSTKRASAPLPTTSTTATITSTSGGKPLPLPKGKQMKSKSLPKVPVTNGPSVKPRRDSRLPPVPDIPQSTTAAKSKQKNQRPLEDVTVTERNDELKKLQAEWREKCDALQRENRLLQQEIELRDDSMREEKDRQQQRRFSNDVVEYFAGSDIAQQNTGSSAELVNTSHVLNALEACALDCVFFTNEFASKMKSNENNTEYMTEREWAYHMKNSTEDTDRIHDFGNKSGAKMKMFASPDEHTHFEQLTKGRFSMGHMRTIESKRNLLFAVMDQGYNRDTAIMVLLFCEQTLEFRVFVDEILMCDRRAFRIYEQVMDEWRRYEQLVKVFRYCGMYEREAALMLKRVIREARSDPYHQFDMYEQCLQFHRTHQHTHHYIANFTPWIEYQLKLMSRQFRIERNDRRVAAEGREPMFKRWPRSDIVGRPAQHLIWYSLFYHASAASGKLSSPHSIVQLLDINNRRHLYTGINARCHARDWGGVQRMIPVSTPVSSKITNIFKGSNSSNTIPASSSQIRLKKDCPLELADIIGAIRKYDGPTELLDYVFELWRDDPERKYACAMKPPHACYNAAIEASYQMRDKERLEQLRAAIVEEIGASGSSQYREKIDALLNNPKTKWITPKHSVKSGSSSSSSSSSSLLGKIFK